MVTTDQLGTGQAGPGSVLVLDATAVAHITLIDTEGEPALRVRAHPCLKDHRGSLLAIVGQRNQYSAITFLTLRELHGSRSSFRPSALRPHPHSQRGGPYTKAFGTIKQPFYYGKPDLPPPAIPYVGNRGTDL